MNDWTDDQVTLLKTLWSAGYSGSQAASVLGGDITREAVMGKLHRLGLNDDERPIHRRTTKPLPPARPPEPIENQPISLLTVGFGQCRYPLWADLDEPGEMLICGAKVKRGSYCDAHAVRCYGKESK
jgi:GcrA cell cycle regulator